MVAHLLVAQKTSIIIKPIFILVLLLAGCQTSQPGECSGCIIIDQNDSSSPVLAFRGDQENGQRVGVTAGEHSGSEVKMTLAGKTGKLFLIASAEDQESGVQALEIWVRKEIYSCDVEDRCSDEDLGLKDKPTFQSTLPQLMPGEATPASSILIQWLDLSKEIAANIPAGESLTINLTFSAVSVNHLGERTQTPDITVVWKEL